MRDSCEITEEEFVESVMAFEEEFSRIMAEREMQDALGEGGEFERYYYYF